MARTAIRSCVALAETLKDVFEKKRFRLYSRSTYRMGLLAEPHLFVNNQHASPERNIIAFQARDRDHVGNERSCFSQFWILLCV